MYHKKHNRRTPKSTMAFSEFLKIGQIFLKKNYITVILNAWGQLWLNILSDSVLCNGLNMYEYLSMFHRYRSDKNIYNIS